MKVHVIEKKSMYGGGSNWPPNAVPLSSLTEVVVLPIIN